MNVYYEIHPQGGIRRTARRGTRQLAAGFYGVGCPRPAIECLIAQLTNSSCIMAVDLVSASTYRHR